MRATDIKLGDMKTFRIKDMRISHCPNEHALLQLEGYISETEIEKIQRLALTEEVVQVSAVDERGIWNWYGLVYDMEIQHLLHDKYLKLVLISQSVKMDQVKRTRSFQKEGTLIGDIIEYMCKDYDALVTINGADIKMDGMLVQYQETDWEFLKRLASHMNQQVIVHSKCVGLVLDIGLSSKNSILADAPSMVIYRKDIQALRHELDYELSEAEVDTIIFESREIYDITNGIGTDKGDFFIYRVESLFRQEELVMKYVGYRRLNFKVPLLKNKKIIGASLNGRVHAVSGSKVQVNLDVDVNNTLCGNKDFSYATVYSSNAGTGWYCMPEKGDTVRVYFPSDVEKNAYAISSVHLDVDVDTSRSNPEIKSISNAQNKQIVFSPEGILLQNTENMYISLNDTEGITIVSNLPICIRSDMNVTLDAAENIIINGMSQVALKQGIGATTDSTILLNEGTITVSGVEFRLVENEGV